MASFKDMKKRGPRTFLWYGGSGTGKTRGLYDFPNKFVLDFDDHLQPLIGAPGEGVTYKDEWANGVMKKKGITEAYKKLDEIAADCPYDLVAWDNISAFETMSAKLSAVLNKRKDNKIMYMDYGSAATDIKDWLYRLLQLPCKVVVITHEILLKDDIEGNMKIMPYVCGSKLPPKLMNMFDETYRFTAERNSKQEAEYIIQTRGARQFQANTRSETTPTSIAWTNGSLYKELIECGTLKEKKDDA